MCLLYAGTRGHLDKLQTSEIAAFELAYLEHLKANHQQLLADIKKTGILTKDQDQELHNLLTTWIPQSGLKMK